MSPSRCYPSGPLIQGQASIESSLANVFFLFTQLKNRVKIEVNVKDFKNSSDAYPFHIHAVPITGQDCKSAKGHYDPFVVNPNGNSTSYKCNKDKVETCEVGDLSGKFGKLNGVKQNYVYFDHTIGHLSDLIDKTSVVIHLGDANKTRIGCANIVKKE